MGDKSSFESNECSNHLLKHNGRSHLGTNVHSSRRAPRLYSFCYVSGARVVVQRSQLLRSRIFNTLRSVFTDCGAHSGVFSRIRSAAFSAIMIVGAFVLDDVMCGITEASQ